MIYFIYDLATLFYIGYPINETQVVNFDPNIYGITTEDVGSKLYPIWDEVNAIWVETATIQDIDNKVNEYVELIRTINSSTDGYVVDWIETNRPIPTTIEEGRQLIRQEYLDNILRIKPDYELPEINKDNFLLRGHETVATSTGNIYQSDALKGKIVVLAIVQNVVQQHPSHNTITGELSIDITIGDNILILFR